MLPVSLVENKFFKSWLETVDPPFNIPTVRTLKKNGIYKSKDDVLAKIKKICQHDLKYPSVTLDLWSDATMRTFFGLNVHGIETKWKIVKFTGAFQIMTARHTAIEIKSLYDEIVEELGIDEKKIF
jgi:hypothetical protein